VTVAEAPVVAPSESDLVRRRARLDVSSSSLPILLRHGDAALGTPPYLTAKLLPLARLVARIVARDLASRDR
jgi:hypothetical protein